MRASLKIFSALFVFSAFALLTPAAGAIPLPVNKVAAGAEHTCAISSGAASCWGAGNYGQLGYGGVVHQQTPREVVNLASGVLGIDSSLYASCAVTAAGAVKCWGDGGYGRLGNGSTNLFDTPQQVEGLTSGATAVATAVDHACALVSGRVYCWGSGMYGVLGNGANAQEDTPVEVTALGSGVSAISAGSSHTCALKAGAVWCWGRGQYGVLGNDSYSDQNLPVDTGLSGVTSIGLGARASCAIAGGSVKCWGQNNAGQLGVGDDLPAKTPRQVQGLTSGVTDISYGDWHGCAVQSGLAKCWGSNSVGQLGIGTSGEEDVLPLTAVISLPSPVTQVSAGNAHTCAVAAGYGYCWGDAQEGQLGNGVISTEPGDNPIATPTPQEVTASFTPPGGLGNGPGGGGGGGGTTTNPAPSFRSVPKRAKASRPITLKTNCASSCSIKFSMKIGKKKVSGLKSVKLKAGLHTTKYKLPKKVVSRVRTAVKKKIRNIVLTVSVVSTGGTSKKMRIKIS